MPTKIEWTGETWNPVRARLKSEPARVGWHCTHASDGCKFCYAERMNKRGIGTGLPYKPGHEKDIEIFLDEKVLLYPTRWARPRLIFPGSMTDLFAPFVTDAMLDQIFGTVAATPRHTYQFLTKRPDRMAEYTRALWACGQHGLAHVSDSAEPWPFENCWMGTSVEDVRVRHRIDELREVSARVRWLSIEPLIGRIPDIDLTGIDWVVVGGESGPGARPMHSDWAREIRDACAAQGVAFFFKQWGESVEIDGSRCMGHGHSRLTRDGSEFWVKTDGTIIDRRHRLYSCMSPYGPESLMIRVGKKAAGRVLDRVTHDAMPATN